MCFILFLIFTLRTKEKTKLIQPRYVEFFLTPLAQEARQKWVIWVEKCTLWEFAVRIKVLVQRKYKKGRKVRKCFPLAPTHSPMQVSQLPGEWYLLVTCPVFHLQERSKILNCHRLIFLTKYNVNIPLLFHILKASHKCKLPTSLTYGSSLSNNNYKMYLLNVKMLLVVQKPCR